jgi:UDP-sulfoquinovose synthase
VRTLAELVAELTGADIRHYVNPRNEAPDNSW